MAPLFIAAFPNQAVAVDLAPLAIYCFPLLGHDRFDNYPPQARVSHVPA
jgi:hypothetical protein